MLIRLRSSEMTKKTFYSIAICSILGKGMVYFEWYVVNPHVQAVQNMCGTLRSQPIRKVVHDFKCF